MREVDMYLTKLMPPPVAEDAGVNGGALYAFFRRSFPAQEEAIAWFLSSQGWSEVQGTRQQLVLSPSQAETILSKTSEGALVEFQEHGYTLRICVHTEDDAEVFDTQRFFQ